MSTMDKAIFKIWLLKENLENAPQILATLNELGEVTCFARFGEMISSYNQKDVTPDLIVTEYNLRTRSFIESMAQWNQSNFFEKIPTVMISTMECPETIRGLFRSGLREYFTSPLSYTELLIKTEQILQNLSHSTSLSPYLRHGKKIITGLTRKEIQIFQFLQSKRCNTATRNELQAHCWPEQSTTGQTLNVHIHNMRRKLFPYGLNIRGQKNGVWKLEEVDRPILQS